MAKLFRHLRFPAAFLLCLAIPALLVTTNLRVLLFDRGFYEAGFAKNGIVESTGLSREVLSSAAEQMITYFEGGDPVSLVVDKEWGRERVFNEREQIHLADVRDLVRLDLTVQWLAALGLAVGTVATIAESRRGIAGRLSRRYLAGAALTLEIGRAHV